MKNLKKYIAATFMVMVVFCSPVFAATGSNVPDAVTASFNKKYPAAQVKALHFKKGAYVAKAVIDNKKYSVSFDKDGNWLSTASNIAWKWNLPANITSAYNKTEYNNWNVYFAKKVEKPSGEYYQLMVDDTNLHVGQNHQLINDTDKLLEFKADGALAMVQDITKDPVP